MKINQNNHQYWKYGGGLGQGGLGHSREKIYKENMREKNVQNQIVENHMGNKVKTLKKNEM